MKRLHRLSKDSEHNDERKMLECSNYSLHSDRPQAGRKKIDLQKFRKNRFYIGHGKHAMYNKCKYNRPSRHAGEARIELKLAFKYASKVRRISSKHARFVQAWKSGKWIYATIDCVITLHSQCLKRVKRIQSGNTGHF